MCCIYFFWFALWSYHLQIGPLWPLYLPWHWLRSQRPSRKLLSIVLECVQLIKGRALRVVFPSTDVMKDMISGGLTFRDHPVQYKAPSVYKWVTVLDLPYSIPEGEIKTVLSAIPSRIVVAGHPCTICYRGQVRSCFRCSQTGHEAKTCPQKTAALSRPTATISIVPPAAPSGTVVFTASPTSPRTFASVLSGQVVPTVIDTLSSTPTSPFPKQVLLLPLGPVDETAHGVSEMDTGGPVPETTLFSNF